MVQPQQISTGTERAVQVPFAGLHLQGDLSVPAGALGVVLFAHGSGSSRHSPRNRLVARTLNEAHIATLLFDLLTRAEEAADQATAALRFDIGLLAERLVAATMWISEHRETAGLPVGYFGASTGGAAALVAAARMRDVVAAVVSRGGRPDLAGAVLEHVRAPTLLLVGQHDGPVIRMNKEAAAKLGCIHQLVIVPGATHLFEEPGALEEVASQAAGWFARYLPCRQ